MRLNLIVCILATASYPQDVDGQQIIDSSKVSVLEQGIQEELLTSRTPGAVFAVVQNGIVLFHGAFGLANVTTQATLQPNAVFAIGSVSKLFTALALLTALEQNGIDVDAPVGSVVRGLSPGLSALTFGALLSNTSGMLDYWPNTNVHPDDLFELFARAGDGALFEEQARVFSYSNRGFALAALALSRLTGLPFSEALDSLITRPLKLAHTTLDVREVMLHSFAAGHITDRNTGTLRPVSFGYLTDPVIQPAGGVFSNIPDLVRLATCLMNDGVIDKRRIFSSTTVARVAHGLAPMNAGSYYLGYPRSAYGAGSIVFELRGIQFVGNAGAPEMSNTLFLFAPAFKTIIVALSNSGYPLSRSIERAVELFLPSNSSAPLAWSTERKEALVGSYFAPRLDKRRDDLIAIRSGESGLFIKLPNGREYPLTRVGELTYEYRLPDSPLPARQIAFYLDSRGAVKYLNQGWRTRIRVE